MPAVTTYGVDILVELAIGRATDAALWGRSTWGQSRWGTSDTAAGDWVDVTCDVLDGLRLSAGSNTDDGVTRRWESASAAFTLAGSQWDPWNGPHRDILGDRTPVRVSWRASTGVDLLTGFGVHAEPRAGGWVAAFTGFIATRGYAWNADDQLAAVACVDGTSVLVASVRVPSVAQGAGETASARVTRLATAALWPAAYDVTAGGTVLQATTLATGGWDELLAVADTDLALLWVTRAGTLAYRPRGRVGQGNRLSGRLVVCEAGPDDVGVITMGRQQPTASRNRATVARRKDDTVPGDAPVAVLLDDRESIARFQAHAYTRTDLWHATDVWSTTLAQAIIVGGAWPSRAPGAAVLNADTGDARVPALLLTLEPDMTFTVADDGGSTYTEAVMGWDVEVRHGGIDGTLVLEDVTRWADLGEWGSALWGTGLWGIGGF